MCLYSRVGEDDAAPAAPGTVSSHQLPSSAISRLQETKVLPCIPSRSGWSLTAPGGHFHSPVKAVQASREQRTMGACRPMVTVDASLTPLYVSEKPPADTDAAARSLSRSTSFYSGVKSFVSHSAMRCNASQVQC